MDDEHEQAEIDTRLRAAMSPPAGVADRVAARALSVNAGPRRRPLRAALLIATALLVLVVMAWQVRRNPAGRATSAPSLAVSGQGSIVVVVSDDGRRWVVGPSTEPRTAGSYVIVVSE